MNEKIESIINGLSSVEKDALYRRLWFDYVKEDIIRFCEDNDIAYTDESFVDKAAKSYIYDGKYDCNLNYWDNIKNLIDSVLDD